jgi:hypothetical protein
MDKKIFLVVGPESSGNHLTSLVLKTMGCYWEEPPQKLDSMLKGEIELASFTDNSNIVLRRSVPYGHEWISPALIRHTFANLGYTMHTIILQREWMATMLSNYYHRSSTVEEANEVLVKAEKHIASHMAHGLFDPFYVLNTSTLMKDPEPVVKGLELYTGLKWPDGVSYESIIKDSDIGRHQLLLDHGFKSIDRMKHKKYITKPLPLVLRKKENQIGSNI